MVKKTKKVIREELLALAIDAVVISAAEFERRAGNLTDISSKTARGQTLLYEVVGAQQIDKIRVLIELGAVVDVE